MLRSVMFLVAIVLASAQTQSKHNTRPASQMSMGILAVESDHEGALYVDGERKLPISPGKILTVNLIAGQHFVDLRDKDGKKLWQKVVDIPAGKQVAQQIQVGPSSAQARIGRVDFQKAITSTRDAGRGAAELAAKFSPKQFELKRMQTELERLEAQVQSQVGPNRQDTELQVTKVRQSLKTATGSFQAEFEQARNPILQAMKDKMMLMIGTYAKEKGLVRVIDSKEGTTLFEAEGASPVDVKEAIVDITQEVVALYEGGQSSSTTDIGGQIDEVARSGRFTALPQPQAVGSGVTGGQPGLLIENRTAYELTILMSGPVQKTITVPVGKSEVVALPGGSYRVLGRVNASNVLPFFGTQTYSSGVSYSESFFIR